LAEVAIVKTTDDHQKAFQKAIALIGGIGELDISRRDVTVKIGVYDPRVLNHPTLEATQAVVAGFTKARRIFLAESNNHINTALERLRIWKEVFNERVLPFNLSEDRNVREAKIVNEKIYLSHILYKPFVRVSFHAFRGLRGPGEPLYGSALKNLLGTIPDIEKQRFHNQLSTALVDILEAIGGLDLAVLDATYTYYGKFEEGRPLNKMRTNLLILGRDAVAVDAVGIALTGKNPLEIPSLVEATKRGLGQVDMKKIEVRGEAIKDVKIELPRYYRASTPSLA